MIDVETQATKVGAPSNAHLVLGIAILAGIALWVTWEKKKYDAVSMVVKKTNYDWRDLPGYLVYNVPQVRSTRAPLYNPSQPFDFRPIPVDKPDNANFNGGFGGATSA